MSQELLSTATRGYRLMSASRESLAWIQPRPAHCDRGRWYANIDARVWQSENDPWPRYYFMLPFAFEEVRLYLVAKKVDVNGSVWVDDPYLMRVGVE